MERIGIVGRFNITNIPLSIQNKISPGLTELEPNGDVKPALATSWQVDSTATEYIFSLSPDRLFHDGKRFTSHDINYSLKGATFTPIDDLTLKVNIEEQYAPLLSVLSAPLYRKNLIGLGPYRVSKLIYRDDTVSELVLIPVSPQSWPTLMYKFYQSTSDALLAFKTGEINRLTDIVDISEFKDWNTVTITPQIQYDRFVGVFFNLQNPLFKEKEIRQALAYALPKMSDEEKAYTPISPHSWAYSQKIRLYNPDLDAANKIVSKSPLGSNSQQLTLSTFAPYLSIAEKIAQSWNAAGISVKVKVESTLPSDYQVALLAQVIPADPDQYQFWQSTQETVNITHYSNPKIDKLLEDGRKTLDQEARKKIYADFQRYLVDDAPVLFLYYPKVYTVERK